jgi:hypothetical protein
MAARASTNINVKLFSDRSARFRSKHSIPRNISSDKITRVRSKGFDLRADVGRVVPALRRERAGLAFSAILFTGVIGSECYNSLGLGTLTAS